MTASGRRLQTSHSPIFLQGQTHLREGDTFQGICFPPELQTDTQTQGHPRCRLQCPTLAPSSSHYPCGGESSARSLCVLAGGQQTSFPPPCPRSLAAWSPLLVPGPPPSVPRHPGTRHRVSASGPSRCTAGFPEGKPGLVSPLRPPCRAPAQVGGEGRPEPLYLQQGLPSSSPRTFSGSGVLRIPGPFRSVCVA